MLVRRNSQKTERSPTLSILWRICGRRHMPPQFLQVSTRRADYLQRRLCLFQAVVAYLGAARRVTSPNAMFMVHRTMTTLSGTPAMTMKGVTKSLALDDERVESILKEDITLPADEKWSNLDHYDFFFSGKEAVDIGLAHEFGEFSPPRGCPVYYFSAGILALTALSRYPYCAPFDVVNQVCYCL